MHDAEDGVARTVWRTQDAMQAELLVDFLADNGVKARIAGARAGVVMMSGVDEVSERRLEVDAEQAEEAERLIEEFLAARPVADDLGDAYTDEDSDSDND